MFYPLKGVSKLRLTKTNLPYIAIFILFFFNSNINNNISHYSILFLLKYGIFAFILLLSIYFFITNKTKNYLKTTLLIPFTIDYQLHLAFIVLTLLLYNKKLFLKFNSPLKPIYILFFWGLFSFLVNQFIEINLLSFPIFTFTFFISFIFFGLFTNLGLEFKDELVKFFYNLVLIMSAVIIMQIILYPDLHPDYWNGGTPHAHISAAYLSIAFIMSTIKLERIRTAPFRIYFREIITAAIALPILFLIDAKYFLVLTLVILIGYFFIFSFVSRKIKALSFGVLSLLIILFFSTPEKPLPLSLLTLNTSKYNLNRLNAKFKDSPREKLIEAAVKLPFEEPLVFLIGSGPGTFTSRAAYLQFNLANSSNDITYNYGREKINFTSKFAKKDTWIRSKYAKDAFYDKIDLGSLFNRRTGLISIYVELGIVGLGIFIFFHFYLIKSVLKEKNLPKTNLMLAVIPLTVLFLSINYFSYWCEYPNYCIIQYGILSLLLSEFNSTQVSQIAQKD